MSVGVEVCFVSICNHPLSIQIELLATSAATRQMNVEGEATKAAAAAALCCALAQQPGKEGMDELVAH